MTSEAAQVASPRRGEAVEDKLTLLNELASGEDEFDIDLMACGCRVRAVPTSASRDRLGGKHPVIEYIRAMPNVDTEALYRILAGIVDDHHIDDRALLGYVERATSSDAEAAAV